MVRSVYDELARRRTAPGPAQPRPTSASGRSMAGGEPADPASCLLELVSELAGETWTDRPSCVHPTLGAVARAVQDHSTDGGREELRALAPSFIGTAHRGFETPARLVAICVSTALASPDRRRITAEESSRLTAARRTALHLLASRAGADATAGVAAEVPRLCGAARWWMPVLDRVGLGEPFYRCYLAEQHAAGAVAVTARASGDDGDRRLRQLLALCIAATGRAEVPDSAAATDGVDAAGVLAPLRRKSARNSQSVGDSQGLDNRSEVR